MGLGRRLDRRSGGPIEVGIEVGVLRIEVDERVVPDRQQGSSCPFIGLYNPYPTCLLHRFLKA